MLQDLADDIRRCGATHRERLAEILLNTGMWAVFGYRFCRWVYLLDAPWLVRIPLNFVAAVVTLFVRVTTQIELPGNAKIGPGLYIAHTGCIVVNSRAVIGSHCTLTHGVTIGHRGGGRARASGTPVIGDRVYVGPGAAIIGPITIGSDALVAVGAIVTQSVPARGVVAGNPARLLSSRGSFDLIEYPGMECDPYRLAALAKRDHDAAPEFSLTSELIETRTAKSGRYGE